jgi:hypothetical protein
MMVIADDGKAAITFFRSSSEILFSSLFHELLYYIIILLSSPSVVLLFGVMVAVNMHGAVGRYSKHNHEDQCPLYQRELYCSDVVLQPNPCSNLLR